MRLISQDGTKDYSYETTSVSIETIMERVVAGMGQTGNYENKVHHYEIVCTDRYGIMGEYSTEEKALKVMETLQQQYMRHLSTVLADVRAKTVYFKFPADEAVNDVSA